MHAAIPLGAFGFCTTQPQYSCKMAERELSVHAVHKSESEASFQSSISDWGAEHVLDSGIKLPPGTALYEIAVEDLRPTQLAVGMQQVHDKMNKLQKKQSQGPAGALNAFLQKHPVPVVIGPGGQHYLIDHHHLTRAMTELGIHSCYAGTVADYSELNEEQFWQAMARRNFLWPYGADGSPVDVHMLPQLLPKTVAALADDPYRSLAALVRKAGGYQKSSKPFSEFIWANFLRPRVHMVLLGVPDVETYVHKGLSHAVSAEAAELPGHTPLESMTAEQLDLMSTLGRTDV